MFLHTIKFTWNSVEKPRLQPDMLLAHAFILEGTYTYSTSLPSVKIKSLFTTINQRQRQWKQKRWKEWDTWYSLEKDCKIKGKLPGNHLVLIAPVVLNKENSNISHLQLTSARHCSQNKDTKSVDRRRAETPSLPQPSSRRAQGRQFRAGSVNLISRDHQNNPVRHVRLRSSDLPMSFMDKQRFKLSSPMHCCLQNHISLLPSAFKKELFS